MMVREWFLNQPVEMKNFNKFEKLVKIKNDLKEVESKYLSLLLDGKKVK